MIAMSFGVGFAFASVSACGAVDREQSKLFGGPLAFVGGGLDVLSLGIL
jgi:hypothetical protein